MIRIRKTREEDIDAVMDIENQQFLHPWKRKYFADELDHDIAYFYIAEDTDTGGTAGYIIFWVIEDTMELHNIAVSGEYKRKGVGKQLFDFMTATAKRKGVLEVFLEVRQSNAEAIGFYEKLGFKQIYIRKDYYNNPVEDAVIYKLSIKK
jgi:ribosomal-protein-alanine N-acetyltransferase